MSAPPDNSKIYFLMPEGGNAIKIGISGYPPGRLRALQPGNPSKLKILAMVPGTLSDERMLHALFQKARIHFEWFSATPKLLETIEVLKTVGKIPDGFFVGVRPSPSPRSTLAPGFPLRNWRVKKGFTVKEAAIFCGIPASTFSCTERGITMPSPQIMAQILGATGDQITPNDHWRAWRHAHPEKYSQFRAAGRHAAREHQTSAKSKSKPRRV